MSACAQCGAPIPENRADCPECGQSALHSTPVPRAGRDRLLAALCYFFAPAVVFIFLERFKRNQFVRFHAFQSLLTWLVILVGAGLIKLVSMALFLIPSLGQLITFLLWIGYALAVPILLLLLMVKAAMGDEFELPMIGALAHRQASKS